MGACHDFWRADDSCAFRFFPVAAVSWVFWNSALASCRTRQLTFPELLLARNEVLANPMETSPTPDFLLNQNLKPPLARSSHPKTYEPRERRRKKPVLESDNLCLIYVLGI